MNAICTEHKTRKWLDTELVVAETVVLLRVPAPCFQREIERGSSELASHSHPWRTPPQPSPPGRGESIDAISCSPDQIRARAHRLRTICSALLCLLFALSGGVAAASVDLPKNLQQGQLVIGHAAPGTHVSYDGRDLRVGDDGIFVFGLGRDAPETIQIKTRDIGGQTTSLSRKVQQRSYHLERVNGLPPQTVTPSPKIAARIAREQGQVAEARQRDDAREDFSAGFRRPVKGGRISGVYGSQRINNGIPKSPHYGLDMAVPSGTPVHAPAAGIVSFAADHLYLTGGTILIDHGYGLDSSFLHMSRVDVKVGQQVKQGEVIGAVGMTGRATGPHLHWGFNWFGVRLDPALLPKPVN